MPRTARIYISLIVSAGAAVLLIAAGSWASTSLPQFVTLLGFAGVSSTLKIRIPGLESTMSPNFIFLLLAMLCCSFSEVASIALVAALAQSLWAAKRPRLIQVVFSAAVLVLSATVAFESARLLLGSGSSISPLVFAILAGTLYLPLNTALISAVIGLVEGRPSFEIARICYECVFPYFMGGLLFAGMVCGAFSRSSIWQGAAVLFPVAVLGYLYFLSRTPILSPARFQSADLPTEGKELVGVGPCRLSR
jgi:hypothetical protein